MRGRETEGVLESMKPRRVLNARSRATSAGRALLFVFGTVLLAGALPLGHAEATCHCHGEDLQIAFLLDCSGSMNHMLGTLQEQIKRVVEVLEGQARSLQVAVVIYRTQEYVGKQRKLDILPFTSDRQSVSDFLSTQTADGGGEELVDDGLAALDQLKWVQGARKVAVLMGDEQPVESREPRCLELARRLKERGIILNAVTGSQTAWIYWAPANTTSWKQQLMDMGDEAKRVFRLPYFDDLAAAGGGISVSSWNSRELVLWLLAFGFGLSEREAKVKIDVGRFLEWSKQRDLSEARAKPPGADAGKPAGVPLIAWLRHRGAWQVPRHFDALFEHLGERLVLSGPPEAKVLDLTDPALERFPILYVTGHGPVKWNQDERERLKVHLERGGFLIADACCGTPEFTASVREILKELFPERALHRLPAAHALFSCGHRIERVKRSAAPRTGQLEPADPELYGLELPDPTSGRPRLAVVLSPASLGCAWATRPFGMPCQYDDADGLALTSNILVWALTR
jgi:hypothetical protein